MASPLSRALSERPAHACGARLWITLLVLLVLTGASWALAHAPLGPFHAVVALGIAVLKASAVASIFMELAREGAAQRVIALVTLAFIVIMCLGVAADTALR